MEDVETFLTTVYVAVDDVYQARIAPLRRRQAGRPPAFADSEVLTVTLAQQLLGIDSERTWSALLRRNWGGVFPHLPSSHEFNRRARHLMGALRPPPPPPVPPRGGGTPPPRPGPPPPGARSPPLFPRAGARGRGGGPPR